MAEWESWDLVGVRQLGLGNLLQLGWMTLQEEWLWLEESLWVLLLP